jgi:signal transduction histidine kinase
VSVLNWTLAELQEDGVGPSQAKEKLARLVKGSDRLCELIDQLVRSYDYDEALPEGEAEKTDLSRIVSDSADMQRPLAAMSESTIDADVPGSSLWVRANALELSRVIDNLVRNAIKHNPEGTHVRISVRSKVDTHEIDVADDGRGIAPEHVGHIFEPGYRVDPLRKDSQGLGLDIVKTLVDRLGGQIAVRSAVGVGTTFTVSIPACALADEHESDNGNGGNGK